MNKIILIGRLTRDPEMKYTQSGDAVANFSVAVDRKYKNADGAKQADFINCVSWRKQAELIEQYVEKGQMVGVEGSLQMRKYQTKDGENRTVYEVNVENIQFLSWKNDGESDAAAKYENGTPEGQSRVETEEKLPFYGGWR